MPDMRLQFIIDAKNKTDAAYRKVHKNMDKVSDKLKKHRKAFKAMAVAGVAAMGAVTLAMATAIKEAAKAEGSYNKFNAVFGEHRDDMLEFVKDIRTRMPTATHEIVRMTANLQDLLVPLGLSRGLATEMTKGFTEVANQIAAFNDVDPTEVIEAISSALAGSSEPLRRFGVNALETSLETKAMQMGLVEAGQSFKDLDVNVKNQIRAQALLAQIIDNSADAIAGFESNNDSFIRRQQELTATIKEAKKTLGEVFLPIIDDILKKILPVVEKIGEWIEKNPELTRTIVVVTAAVATLVAILGTLGLILPGILTMLGMLHLSMLPITAVIALVVIAVIQLIRVGWVLYKDWNLFLGGMILMFKKWKDKIMEILNKIIEDFKFFVEVIWDAVTTVFTNISNFLTGVVLVWAQILEPIWIPFITATGAMKEFFMIVWTSMIEFLTPIVEKIRTLLIKRMKESIDDIKIAIEVLKAIWEVAWNAMEIVVSKIWEKIESPLNSILDVFDKVIGAAKSAWEWTKKAVGKVAEVGVAGFYEGRQHGGYIPETKPYLLHKGETVIPAGAGVGRAITVNIMGGNYLSREAATMFGKEIADELKRDLKL